MMQTVTVSQTTCEALAVQYLGDASQFVRIMSQNNLIDPDITDLVTLTIPDVDPTQTGGVLPQ
jgi:hypothetical protein